MYSHIFSSHNFWSNFFSHTDRRYSPLSTLVLFHGMRTITRTQARAHTALTHTPFDEFIFDELKTLVKMMLDEISTGEFPSVSDQSLKIRNIRMYSYSVSYYEVEFVNLYALRKE